MDRLTRKVENEERYIANNFKKEKGESLLNAIDNFTDKVYNKLGQLEDLEEKIGCSLEVLFKLARQRFFYYKEEEELHLINCFDIQLFNNNIYFEESWRDHDIELGDFGVIELPLSEYGQTWWLKQDRSE